MATRKRLSFSSDGDGDGDISVSEIAKHYSILAAGEEEEPKKETKKKKRKRKSKKWSEEDELTVLKGLIDYGAKNPDFDWDKFYSYAQGCVKANVSEKQMISKIRKLKKNFLFHKKLIEQGNDPLFTRCSDSEAFGYASLLWTPNDELQSKKGGEETMNGAEQAKECRTGGEETRGDDDDDGELQAEKALLSNQEETMNADEQAGNGDEPVNENGAENRESLHEESRDGGDDDETFQADMQVDEPVNVNGAEQAKECRTGGEESREEEEDDECCGVRDALETQVLKGVSDDQKKFHLEKMMNNIGNELRKELSDEWKEISAELVRLNIKKLRFTAKVAEVANDG